MSQGPPKTSSTEPWSMICWFIGQQHIMPFAKHRNQGHIKCLAFDYLVLLLKTSDHFSSPMGQVQTYNKTPIPNNMYSTCLCRIIFCVLSFSLFLSLCPSSMSFTFVSSISKHNSIIYFISTSFKSYLLTLKPE